MEGVPIEEVGAMVEKEFGRQAVSPADSALLQSVEARHVSSSAHLEARRVGTYTRPPHS